MSSLEAPARAARGASATAEPHIVVEGLEKSFGDTHVLKGVNLRVGRGHIAVIIGGSGAGKTTLLRILIGLERPSAGSVRIGGLELGKATGRELDTMRTKFGMVFQYSALLDSMNVLDNVAFPLREHTKLKEKEIRAKVSEKLGVLGLAGTESKFPSQLSGGMRKRVALARALMLEPEVLMYDEPTSGLDPLSCRMVDDLILSTRDRFNVTSIVISHDMVGALEIADEIYLLAGGQVVASGSPQELVDSDNELVAKFLAASGASSNHGG